MTGLKVLVACASCGRSYDASAREVGSRFRCLCGNSLTVTRPRAHEAAVVRCSSCGAPRLGQAARCSFCDADFTLREQDLDTLCPHCMARASSRGRFCHGCGAALVIEGTAGEASELRCPVCRGEQRLTSRRLGTGGPAALECGRCAGLFVGREVFRLLAEAAQKERLVRHETDRRLEAPPRKPAAPRIAAGAFYRACPHCTKHMNRRNYGRSSGVLIDVCGAHGVWFDAHELEAVVAWIKNGGMDRQRDKEMAELGEDERRHRIRENVEADPLRRMLSERPGRGGAAGWLDGDWSFLEGLADLFIDLPDFFSD